MPLLKVELTRKSEYLGLVDEAPRWVRWHHTKWYRRILVAPSTLYLVGVGGVAVSGSFPLWSMENLLCLPAYFLLLTIVGEANKKWYRDRYEEAEELQSARQ